MALACIPALGKSYKSYKFPSSQYKQKFAINDGKNNKNYLVVYIDIFYKVLETKISPNIAKNYNNFLS